MAGIPEPIYQTLSDYLFHPFGAAIAPDNTKFDQSFTKLKNSIKLQSYSVLDDCYYLHILIPSESSAGKYYDVVIEFIPPDMMHKMKNEMSEYVIQFFSNSPSFVYKYAALYKLHGYMIDALQEKLDPNYADVLPKDADGKLSYDKSLYLACKFIHENRLTYLSKSGLRLTHKENFRNMVDSILDNDESLSQTAYDIEQKAKEEGKVDKKKIDKFVKKTLGIKDLPNSNKIPKVIKGKSNVKENGVIVQHPRTKKQPIAKKAKITAKKSTVKK